MPDFFASHNSTHIHKIQDVWPLVVDSDLFFWKQVALKINQWSHAHHIDSNQLIIILPFVQLIAPLRYAWGQIAGNGFLPRMETTRTWSARLGGVHQAGTGPSMDSVLDHLQAKIWLEQLSNKQAFALTDALTEPLVLMANEFVLAAGEVAIEDRDAYWERAQEIAQQTPAGIAGVEAAIGPLAVAWARATEKWSSDVLFEEAQKSQRKKSKGQKAGLVVLQVGGEDRLTKNLYLQWSEPNRVWFDLDFIVDRATNKVRNQVPENENVSLPVQGRLFDDEVFEGFQKTDSHSHDAHRSVYPPDIFATIGQEHPPYYQVAKDAEDEAELAAAQVIRLLNEGVAPVALCSQDRPIARRVWALLQRQHIALADETGWTLSTTRCAALVMGLVNAALPASTPDTILDAFKGLPSTHPFVEGLDELEKHLRVSGLSQWPQNTPRKWSHRSKEVFQRINDVLNELYGTGQRSLWAHLKALDQALKSSMAWSVLKADEAGREVMQVLHLNENFEQNNHSNLESAHAEALFEFKHQALSTHMHYEEFVQWVNRILEGMTFIPVRPQAPQVVLVPLARLTLRPFPAVVIPGCDDSRLTAPPSLSGFWNEADRQSLGLMSRKLWWERLQAQWMHALRLPQVFLIWRSTQGAEPLGPATLVQRVLSQNVPELTDERVIVMKTPQPTWVPAPSPGERFPVKTLSASSYKKLRDCPYQFYVGYLLQLYAQDELDIELTRRDYGNWLHVVLKQFHLQRTLVYPQAKVSLDRALLDQCATENAKELDEASLIPWQARWPALRDAYLRWLQHHECQGGRFMMGEFAMQVSLDGQVVLEGRIDRLDEHQDTPILIDYKTERRTTTQSRVKERYEEIQLPFYALLAQGKVSHQPDAVIPHADGAQAVYLSLDDREDAVESFTLEALDELKELLAQSILHDIKRIKADFPLFPLGQAQTCSYCRMNGLCRKGYWTEVQAPNQQKSEGSMNE